MGKYDPLRDRLRLARDEIEMTFETVADLVGGLPASARRHRQWWENDQTHVQSAAWLSAGYQVLDVDLQAGHVRFSRVQR